MNLISAIRSMVRVGSFCLLMLTLGFALSAGPKIIVNFRGTPLKFTGKQRPIRSQGTVLVPVREVSRLIGAKFSSDGKSVTVMFGSRALIYEPGHHGYKINGKRQNMRPASELHGTRLFVPIRLFTDVTSGKVRAEIR